MIVDANLATYWYVPSPFSAAASTYMARSDLAAPQIVLPEAANALLKYMRAGQISADDVFTAVGRIPKVITTLIDDSSLTPNAARLSATHNHKVYDCLYLALALQRREPLATADRRLAALARQLSIETELIEPA
ncbi:type II toxin-antitoxin system VapC family toxin [Mesorhizobium sp. J428]|uniref:type II toxin-antitoxin system VapC family toxin n=1 Tax=Mesorhizobium sp. J428 TaxID=2898440 RepID=UPI002151676F|nr:type II toxin-antitoxin system VapC family toxin [Mesorhizobium sp. J428]MCR5859287.1 type II toxin-antitoxin system VapC family toxin [Mesorhizobium sp. J428]